MAVPAVALQIAARGALPERMLGAALIGLAAEAIANRLYPQARGGAAVRLRFDRRGLIPTEPQVPQVPVDATFAAFGVDAVYMPAGGYPVAVRVIPRRPDTIVGFGETRIHAETATFELRASEVASQRPGDQLVLDGETFLVQGQPERRDPDRLVWSLDAGPI